MNCPECGHMTKVRATRRKNGGTKIVRHRTCKASGCKHDFTTLEQVAVIGTLRRGRGSPLLREWARSARQRAATAHGNEASS